MDLRDDYLKTKQSRVLEETQSRPMTSAFRIVLNHWPMLTRSATFTKSFLHDLNPNLILKGDSHHVRTLFSKSIVYFTLKSLSVLVYNTFT